MWDNILPLPRRARRVTKISLEIPKRGPIGSASIKQKSYAFLAALENIIKLVSDIVGASVRMSDIARVNHCVILSINIEGAMKSHAALTGMH